MTGYRWARVSTLTGRLLMSVLILANFAVRFAYSQEEAKFEKVKTTFEYVPVHGPFELMQGELSEASKKGIPKEVANMDDGDDLQLTELSASPAPAPAAIPVPVDASETDSKIAAIEPQELSRKLDIGAANMDARDLSIAASHTHLAITSLRRISFWTKDGKLLNGINTVDFFRSVKNDINKTIKDPADATKLLASTYPVNEFYDTRLLFDAYRNRFWIECLARNMSSGASEEEKKHRVTLTAVAVSKTQNPQDGWYSYWWETSRDYQSIGISQKLLVVGGYRPFKNDLDTVTVVPADGLAAGAKFKLPAYKLIGLKNPDGSAASFLAPALQHGTSPANTHFLVNTQGNDTLVVWGIDPNDPTQIFRAGVPVYPYAPPKFAEQSSHPDIKNPQMIHPLNASNIILKTVFRNGRLHAVWQDSKPGDSGQLRFIRLARVDVSSFPQPIPTGQDSGKIDRRFGKRHFSDPPDTVFSYYMPTLAVNADGTMIINYCRSGSSIFPEARYSLYFNKDPDIRPSYLLHKGEYPLGKNDPNGSLGPTGKLDYLGISVDPADDRSVWIINAYGAKGSIGKGRYNLLVQKVPLRSPK